VWEFVTSECLHFAVPEQLRTKGQRLQPGRSRLLLTVAEVALLNIIVSASGTFSLSWATTADKATEQLAIVMRPT
jgi:hypothetical protein